MKKTYILVLRYRLPIPGNTELKYENVTMETTVPITMEEITRVEKETAAKLNTWDSLCKLHNLIHLA